tara:strand:+ start:1337 stop:2575 length:1239 start_codon:yes stop_codon:yes gene_type:complete
MMLAMDAAWVVLKEEMMPYPPEVSESLGSGAYRRVYSHPTNPEQVVKIPFGETVNYGDMVHTAHNQALAAAGEPVLPESPVLFEQPVRWTHDEGSVPGVGFTQTRLEHPTVRTQSRAEKENDELYGSNEYRRLRDIGTQFGYGDDTLTSVLSRDLHGDNLSFNVPQDQLRSLSDEQLRDKILAFDGMSRFASAHDKMGTQDFPEDSSNMLARLLFAHDQDPEKFNAYMAKLGDRAQFDPWMDAIVHQPNPTGRESPAKRQTARNRNSLEIAYDEYIRALNATRRLAGLVQDPYQTTLNEHNKFPQLVAEPTSPYHDTILREAIIRARQLQAERAAQGLQAIPENIYRTKGAEALGHTLRDLITQKIRPQLAEDVVEGFRAAKRNDMGAEVPMVRRLLGPETERQLLNDRRPE